MLESLSKASITLIFVVFVTGIVVAEAKSVNFLERKQTEIDGEDNRKGQIKSSGGELDALQDPFEQAATRIRVSVQQLSPSQVAEKDASKADSDLVAAPPNGPIATITLTPSSSIKHRPSPSSAELVDPSIDEYSEDPFDGSGIERVKPPPSSLKP